MAVLSSKISFPLKISVSMLLGYLLATIPPVVLDPMLLSHVEFKEPRHYPGAWWIIPIGIVLFVSTLILAMRSSRRREVFAMLPFVGALLVSIPIFRPEVPHGNLVFVGATWFLLGALTTWIHDQTMTDPGAHIPVPASTAQVDFIKEETAVWKGVALGLVTAYLAIATGLTLGFHAANRDVVTSARDIFILNSYSNILFAVTSLFMFLGPIYESIKKVVESNQRLLSIHPEPAESQHA